MKLCRSLLAVILLASSARAADSFRAALQGVKTADEALPLAEKYVKEHPRAADIGEAEVTLGRLYGMIGQNDKAVALLDTHYTGMEKGAKGDLRGAMGATSGLVTSYLAMGDKKKAEAAIARLTTDFKSHPEMSKAASSIENLKGELSKPNKGDIMDVSFTGTNGHKVDLAEMKGKVVLVDFWATWCGPCVAELPNVIKAYDAYHDKGFEVIGISLDQDESKLTDFTKEHKMPWPQFFDGKGWENSIATKYGIHSIPATFLIGKDGKVAATNLRGEALETKLGEMLK